MAGPRKDAKVLAELDAPAVVVDGAVEGAEPKKEGIVVAAGAGAGAGAGAVEEGFPNVKVEDAGGGAGAATGAPNPPNPANFETGSGAFSAGAATAPGFHIMGMGALGAPPTAAAAAIPERLGRPRIFLVARTASSALLNPVPTSSSPSA